MTKQNSFLAKILGQSQPEPESSIYALLDRTDRTLKKYFACPDDKSYQTQLLSNLYEEIEWAKKNFVNTSDITYMMTIPISTKDQFLKDFFDFFMSIRIWVQETIQTEKPSNGQKEVLKTTLDDLFYRWSAMLRDYNYVIEKQRLKAASVDTGKKVITQKPVLDEIDRKLIEIYQAAYQENINPPSQTKIAKTLYKAGLTQAEWTKAAVSKRIKKLREIGLIDSSKKEPTLSPVHICDRMDTHKMKF